MDHEHLSSGTEAPAEEEMTLFDLRVTVDEIKGRSVCGMQVGDWFEVRNSDQLSLPPGRHFCFWAIQSVLPLLPAKMRSSPSRTGSSRTRSSAARTPRRVSSCASSGSARSP